MSKQEINELKKLLAEMKTTLALRQQTEDERWECIEAHMAVVQPFVEGVQGARVFGKLLLWVAGIVAAIAFLVATAKGWRV